MGEIRSRSEAQEAKSSATEHFKNIRPERGTTIEQAKTFLRELFETTDCFYTDYKDRLDQTPVDGERGEWEGRRGESKFVPSETTEAGRAVKEKLAKYGLDGITYKDAVPDFSKCAEATVTIDHMTIYRLENNFPKADKECADLWKREKKDGRDDWSATDVREWRRDNHYSWHERSDTKTMDLVPSDIHGYFGHSGGVAECKVRDHEDMGGGFDE